jgi:hypothetical protein
MLKKTYVKSRNIWKVTFNLPKEECPGIEKIKCVHLVGDFNNWRKPNTDDLFQIDLFIEVKVKEFKYELPLS